MIRILAFGTSGIVMAKRRHELRVRLWVRPRHAQDTIEQAHGGGESAERAEHVVDEMQIPVRVRVRIDMRWLT